MGLQHVVAMFGATVLAPILMGFDPQVALFFSGIGTLIFIAVARFKVPSYLGSGFAFIGPVLAVTGGDSVRIPEALGGIAAAALLYALVAVLTLRFGSGFIDRLMSPVVTGSVVALIGLNLAGSAMANALGEGLDLTSHADYERALVAGLTLLTAASVAVYVRGFLRLLPILTGVVAGYALAAAMGLIDPAALERIAEAHWLGLPSFQAPTWTFAGILTIAPVFVVLVAENKGHLAAISGTMGRDLSPHLGRAYLGDAVATFVSAMGGGTPQTTYAENMGVMAMTRVFSIQNFLVASGVAILLGICPKFGAAIQTIPPPVLGGVSIVLYGLITLMGAKIWLDARVDFAEQRNLIVAGASLVVATGLGVKGLTVGGVNIAGIALGTVLAIALNLLMRGGRSATEGPSSPG